MKTDILIVTQTQHHPPMRHRISLHVCYVTMWQDFVSYTETMLNLTGLFSRGESIGNWNNWMREDIHNSPSQKSVGGAG